MTPQMKKIIEDFEESWGFFKIKCTKYLPNGVKLSAGYITEKDVKKEIQKACIEYAKSIIPQEADIDTLGSEVARMNQVGWNECRIAMLNSIEQDSLDLPTN